jgi:hypothetical protein
MKRFATTAMVFALVLAFAGLASAAELKVRGQVQAYGRAMDNWDFEKSKSRNNNRAYEDDFDIAERARLFFDFVANKDLKFIMQLQIGNGFWGQDGFGLGQGDGGTNKSTALRVRQAYLDFNIPDTTVNAKAGYMTVTLPNNYGSSILDEEAAALLVSTPIIDKTLSVLVGYMRLWDTTSGNNTTSNTGSRSYGMRDEFDAAVLALPVKLDGFEATPFFVYGWGGKDSLSDSISLSSSTSQTGDGGRIRGLLAPMVSAVYSTAGDTKFQKDLSVWWTGFSGKMTMFDPFWASASFNYGSLKGGQNVDGAVPPNDNKHINDRAGYLFDLGIGYNGLDMVKPEIFFAYTSGEDSDPTNGSERMPLLNLNAKYTSFWFAGSSFGDGDMTQNVSAYRNEHIGYWLLGLALKKITFMEKLTHDFTFAYIKGTNSASLLEDANTRGFGSGAAGYPYQAGHFLTTKDSLYEFDFNTQYQLFSELKAIVEFGYIVQSLHKDTWNTYYGTTGVNDVKFENAFKAMFGLTYDF